ncbi:MAG: hypothetical protein WAW88_10395 [Nocardioides sp.]
MTEEAVQPAPIDPQRIAETLTLARWRAAEDRIYPLITVDPAIYQTAVGAVARATRLLGSQQRSRAELLTLSSDQVALDLLVDPELNELTHELTARAGVPAITVIEAALAQVVSLSPVEGGTPS